MSGSVPNPTAPTAPVPPGTVWTPEQWIAAWQSKVDGNNPVMNGTITGTAIPNIFSNPPPIGNGTPNTGTFTSLSLHGLESFATGATATWNNVGPTWSGTSTSGQTPVNITGSFFGTAGNVGNLVPLGINVLVNANLDASASLGATGVAVQMNTASRLKGGLTSIQGAMTVNVATANSSTVEYVGVRGFAQAQVNDGGTSGTPRGSLVGATVVAGLVTDGATNWLGLTGLEVAVQSVAGTSSAIKTGVYIMEYAADAVRGSASDRALGFWNQYAQGATTGWKTIIDIGPGGQHGAYFPGGEDSTLIKASRGAREGALTVENILDFSAITTVTGFNIDMPNFAVSGGGIVAATVFQAFGSGDAVINLASAGNAGAVFTSTDGTLLQITNQTPGSSITTWPIMQAGESGLIITVGGSAANKSIAINSSGPGSAIGFQPGAPAQIDINGNITGVSFIVGASGSPTITSGAGAPSSTQPNGSIYLRTNGAANTRLYVSGGGGTWSAISSG